MNRRRALLLLSATTLALFPSRASAFGQVGAFHPRLIHRGPIRDARASGASRWAHELMGRTSAPARTSVMTLALDDRRLLAEPFAIWAGAEDFPPLSDRELGMLERFVRLGGVLVVDDSDPERGAFGRAAKRELARALPEAPPVRLGTDHVLYKSFYLLNRPTGRIGGQAHVEALLRGRTLQVIFLAHDLLGALAEGPDGTWAHAVEPRQRELAIRFAVNIAMYVLCSDYKDDQVHAPFVMRRRRSGSP